jgi:hypothetical protein
MSAVLAAGCGDLFGVACTTELRPNLLVEVRDSVTGLPAAAGATGRAETGGTRAELVAVDSLRLFENFGRERAGRYVIVVRKPGYKTVTDTTNVTEDQCHVRTKTVPVTLARDPAAVAEPVISQSFGNHVQGSSGSAGIRVLGDTIEIVGSAATRCAQLSAIAYRSGEDWHIQLEPGPPLPTCANGNLQSFQVRYRLPAGRSEILVTSAWGQPVVLYQGSVSRTSNPSPASTH